MPLDIQFQPLAKAIEQNQLEGGLGVLRLSLLKVSSGRATRLKRVVIGRQIMPAQLHSPPFSGDAQAGRAPPAGDGHWLRALHCAGR